MGLSNSIEYILKVFLVPLLQSGDVVYETREHCEKFGFTEICSSETFPKKVDVTEEAGIEVVEVENIEEALKYFLTGAFASAFLLLGIAFIFGRSLPICFFTAT